MSNAYERYVTGWGLNPMTSGLMSDYKFNALRTALIGPMEISCQLENYDQLLKATNSKLSTGRFIMSVHYRNQ